MYNRKTERKLGAFLNNISRVVTKEEGYCEAHIKKILYGFCLPPLAESVSPFELLYDGKSRFYSTEDYLSVHSSTLAEQVFSIMSLKPSVFNRIQIKQVHGGQVGDKKGKKCKDGGLVLVQTIR